MPTKPKIVTLTNASVDILNAIRNSATTDYRNYVPYASADADSIKAIGAIIMDYPALQNEFLSALVNRIGRVYITSRMYENPLAFMKKGVLDYGESIEEIFVDIAKVQQYDAELAETQVFKRELPNVRSAFHVVNFKKFYKVTIEERELSLAFLSIDGVTDLIARIVDSIYSGASYDEFQVTKYLLACHLLDGHLSPVTVPEVNATNASAIVTAIKGASNALSFMNPDHNIAGVRTHTPKERQYILVNATFDAVMDVEVLATAFNMNKAEFIGRRVMVDSFGALDTERLGELFDGDRTYREFSEDEKRALDIIPAVLVDEDFFMIFDHGAGKFTENYNGQGDYWNYFYHVWKSFSVSPFAQAVAFIPATPTVQGISLTPAEAAVSRGQSITIVADVDTENFAPTTVTWSSDTEGVTVNASGVVTVSNDAVTGTATIGCRSVYDPERDATATITIV